MKNTKTLSSIALSLAGLALSLGVLSGTYVRKASQTEALFTPTTTYEVSDTASELTSYYSSASGKTGDDLLSALRGINSSKYHKLCDYKSFGTSSDTSPFVYTDYPLTTTSKDSNGQVRGSAIASFYTKTTSTSFNKEHVWPDSKGGNKVENDILMPRPTINSENSSRGNSNFVEGMCDQSAGWDPYKAGYDIECRGECARIMLYCVVASSSLSLVASNSGGSTSCGNMNTLIKWHFDYAPNVYEMNRNNGAEYLQGNRNPFVDHPEYVAKIWSNFNSTVSNLCENNSSKYSNWVPGNYCNYGENTPVQGIAISSSSESITVGTTTTLFATSTDGGTISWTTSNSSVASISASSSSSGGDITVTGVSAGTATITAKRTISGTEYSQSCTITVNKVVSSLSKGSTSPTKTTYTSGESFDPSGLTITATYADSTSGDVTNSVVWSPDPLTAGTKSVTGTFGGKTIEITGLTVNQATEPEKIDSNSDLSVGDYVVLRTAAGVGVTGWNNNKDATVSETESEWKKYYVASASSSGFTLKDESANNFIASPGSSNQFLYGSAATCRTNTDGHLICNNRYLCKNGTNYRFYSSVGSYLPFFIYKVPSSSTKTLSSISVSTAPTKTTYNAGETFDPTGLVISRNYSDSTSDTYTYANHTNEFTFSPSTSTQLTTSDTSVTITYNSKTCSQPITVNQASQATLSSISVSTSPTKTTYTLDECFDPSGLVITRTYSDNSSNTYTYAGHESEFSFDPTLLTPLTTSDTSVTISYGGKNTSQPITVTSSGGQATVNEEVIDLRNQGFTNEQSVTTVEGINSNVTFGKNTGSNDPKYYTSGSAVRVYGGNSITISSEERTILSITFTFGSSDGTNSITSSPGGFNSPTWSGSANSVTFTIGGTKGNRRIAAITITYEQSAATITSITATVDKTYYVGEKIYASDITVKDNFDENVSEFTFLDDGYQFTYEDAQSGGNLTTKVFENRVTLGGEIHCSLEVQVQRETRENKLDVISKSIIPSDLPTSYNTDASVIYTSESGIRFRAYNVRRSNNNLEFRGSSGYIETVDSMNLISLTVVEPNNNALSVYGKTETGSFTGVAGSNNVYSLTNYNYLKVSRNTTYSATCTSLTVSMKGAENSQSLANYVMFEDTQNQCTSKLDVAISYLSKMSSSDRETFASSNDYCIRTARERLEAWATNQGKVIDYSTGSLSNSHYQLSLLNVENNETFIVVLIATLVSVSSIVSFIYVRKRRME